MVWGPEANAVSSPSSESSAPVGPDESSHRSIGASDTPPPWGGVETDTAIALDLGRSVGGRRPISLPPPSGHHRWAVAAAAAGAAQRERRAALSICDQRSRELPHLARAPHPAGSVAAEVRVTRQIAARRAPDSALQPGKGARLMQARRRDRGDARTLPRRIYKYVASHWGRCSGAPLCSSPSYACSARASLR